MEDTITILRGIKDKYEVHHRLGIRDSALISAATLSERYISDRFFPDKAVDLVDEAASKLRMEMNSAPELIDDLNRKLIQLEVEREALKKEKDPKSKERLSNCKKEKLSICFPNVHQRCLKGYVHIKLTISINFH